MKSCKKNCNKLDLPVQWSVMPIWGWGGVYCGMLGTTALCHLVMGKIQLFELGCFILYFWEMRQDIAIDDSSYAFSRYHVSPMFAFICTWRNLRSTVLACHLKAYGIFTNFMKIDRLIHRILGLCRYTKCHCIGTFLRFIHSFENVKTLQGYLDLQSALWKET